MGSTRIHRAGLVVAACGALGLLSAPALAQRSGDFFLNSNRQIEELMRQQFDRQVPATQNLTLDYGGYLTENVFHYNDGIKTRTLSRTELRLWASMSADEGIHTFYVRGYGGLAAWAGGTNPYGTPQTDWEGPLVERLYYTLDLAKAWDKYGGGRPDLLQELNVTVGRQYIIFGTGLALSQPLDAVVPVVQFANVRVTGLGGMLSPQVNDIDISRPGSTMNNFDGQNAQRAFYGVQFEYTGLQKHTPFAYVLWTNDLSTERPNDPFQNYTYNANYFGLGSQGELFLKDLNYQFEYVYQWGNCYGDGRWLGRDPINAMALSGQLQYVFSDVYGKPIIESEYTYASGDNDRIGSNRNSRGGNKGSTADHGFNGFGFRNTGLAFAPELSNVQVIRNTVSWNPFADIELFKDFRIGADFFVYAKAAQYGAVSDPTADLPEDFLGWEMDNWFDWRLTSDFSWTTRIGTFFPGSAFSNQDPRVFIFSGVTYSF